MKKSCWSFHSSRNKRDFVCSSWSSSDVKCLFSLENGENSSRCRFKFFKEENKNNFWKTLGLLRNLEKSWNTLEFCSMGGKESLNFSLATYRVKVPNVKFNFDVSVRHCLLSTHTSKSNLTLGTHLHALMRTHNFDFNVRFWPISALMWITLHRSRILRLLLSVICVYKGLCLL